MTTHYRFIYLIIDSDNLPWYVGLRNNIKRYHNSFPNIKSLFLRADINIENSKIVEDTLYVNGKEDYIPGILDKTIKGMEYCLKNFSFDYLVRTNLSSFWNYYELLKLNLSENNVVLAFIGECNGIKFPAGSGFIISRDIIKKCIQNYDKFDKTLPDDVAFGKYFIENDIPLTMGKRYNFLSNLKEISDSELDEILKLNNYHYRIMGNLGYDRSYDSEFFEKLCKKVYKIKNKYIPDCTLTTANFYLNDQTRNIDECVNNMKSLLSIPCYLVINCNNILYPKIKELRSSFNLDHLTHYNILEFEEIWTYQYIEKIKKNRQVFWPTKDSRAGSESLVITCNKFDFVLKTIEANPFGTTKFGWIDANLGLDGRKISENFENNQLLYILNNISEKFRIQIMGVGDKKWKQLENKKDYYQQYRYIVCGCLFTLGLPYTQILKRLKEIFIQTINEGCGHGEEMLYLEVLDEYYDQIEKAYGDYQQILHNFIEPTRNYIYILNNIVIRYLAFGYYKECKDCCHQVLKTIESLKYPVDYNMWVKFLFFEYVSTYYLDINEAKKIITKFSDLKIAYPLFKDEFDKDREFYESQFQFVLKK